MSSLGNEVTLTISLIELDVKIIFGLGDRVVETILFFNWSITNLQLYVSFRCKNIVVWYFYTLWNDHLDKSSYHLSPYKVTTILLIRFYMLYITFLWFILYKLCLLISLIYLVHFSFPFLSGNHICCLYLWDSYWFYFFFTYSTCKWNHAVFVSLPDLFHFA